MEDILQDIINEQEDYGSKEHIFNNYVEKEIIAKKVFDKFKWKVSKNGLFYLSENNKNVGVISVLDGLKSLAILCKMGIDIRNEAKYLDLLNENLKQLFVSINYQKGVRGVLSYNLTPFVDAETINVPYVDTACKLISAVIVVRDLLLLLDDNDKDRNLVNVPDIGNVNDVLHALNDITNETIEFICDAAIPVSGDKQVLTYKIKNEDGEEESEEIEVGYIGWNFTKFENDRIKDSERKRLEPSLYFTYSVSQAYMAIYESAEKAIRAIRDENVEEARLELEQREVNKFDRDVEFIKTIFESYNRFRGILRGVGLHLDQSIQNIDLRDSYLGIDGRGIDNDEIIRSTTNNALFNTLFAISIMNNSGVFDIYDKYNPEKRRLEYASSVVSNVYDMYMDLEAAKKLYIVEQYVLNFNEFMPEAYFEDANYLRKQRIQVITIIPLLVKTYSLISAWVVQYPQKQMIDYLKLILESRKTNTKEGKKEWIWDKEMYDVTINSIFINTLADFYQYYEKYEEPFIDQEKAISKEKEKSEKDAKAKIQSAREEANRVVQEAEEKVRQLNEERENLPIIVAIKDLVREVLEKELVKYLPNALNQARDYIFAQDNYRLSIKPEEETDADILARSVGTLISAYVYQAFVSGVNKSVGTNLEDYKVLENNKYQGLADNRAYRRAIDATVEKIKQSISDLLEAKKA